MYIHALSLKVVNALIYHSSYTNMHQITIAADYNKLCILERLSNNTQFVVLSLSLSPGKYEVTPCSQFTLSLI